mgnify:CR=1 FL=1
MPGTCIFTGKMIQYALSVVIISSSWYSCFAASLFSAGGAAFLCCKNVELCYNGSVVDHSLTGKGVNARC